MHPSGGDDEDGDIDEDGNDDVDSVVMWERHSVRVPTEGHMSAPIHWGHRVHHD